MPLVPGHGKVSKGLALCVLLTYPNSAPLVEVCEIQFPYGFAVLPESSVELDGVY
jgi:hypothetical protein